MKDAGGIELPGCELVRARVITNMVMAAACHNNPQSLGYTAAPDEVEVLEALARKDLMEYSVNNGGRWFLKGSYDHQLRRFDPLV